MKRTAGSLRSSRRKNNTMRPTALLLLMTACIWGADYFPPPDSDGGWRTLTGATEIRKTAGIDLARLDEAFEFAQRTTKYGGLLVVRHGYLIYEKYYGKGSRAANPNMASIGKTFTSV